MLNNDVCEVSNLVFIGVFCIALFSSMHKDNFFVQKTQGGNTVLEFGDYFALEIGVLVDNKCQIQTITRNFAAV